MTSDTCPKCGSELAAGGGTCPRCLIALALGPNAGSLAEDERPTESLHFEDDLRIPGHLLLGLLGEGGMGQVFLAEDTSLQRRVAIKVMAERLLGSGDAADRFLREARAMARVDHPNVLRLHSFGKVGARSYIVMEYVEGKSLAQKLGNGGFLQTDTALRYVRQGVAALEAAWQHGIIHRDIKPSNLLITSTDQVRVADFGLAKAVELDDDVSITATGQVLGTPLYMSPEQARADAIDFRTDFYALGIVLFEMLTGRPPYPGTVPARIIDQHLHAPFPSVREMRAEVPASVEQLCEWMTRKDPGNRPVSHPALLEVVDGLLDAGLAEASMPEISATDLHYAADESMGIPVTPIFVGRARELDKLNGFLGEALGGRGRVALVTGEAGSGKTTLVSEFARRQAEQVEELVVVQGNCEARTGTGHPFLPFREILARLTGDVQMLRGTRAVPMAHARRLWGLFPKTVEAILEAGPDLVETFVAGEPLLSRAKERAPGVSGWRAGLAELVKKNSSLPPDSRPQQDGLLDQYAQVLIRLSRVQPLLLIMEDLHWVDAGSAALLQHLGHALRDSRILVIGTYRPEEVEVGGNGAHPLRPVVHDLRARLGDVEIPVGQDEGSEFVEAYLDTRPNRLERTFRDELYRRTRGHSLFVVELVRDLQERGMLVKKEDGRWVVDSSLHWEVLPTRIEGVIGARMERLPEAARNVLRLASIEGEEFTAEVVAEALSLPPQEVVRQLANLDRRYRLVQTRGVRRAGRQRLSRYAFRHILFQKYLYGLLDDAERAYMHEETGETLERLYGDQAAEIADTLAAHFEAAGLVDRAIPYLHQAGDRAARISANEEALKHLEHAKRLLRELPDSAGRARQELALQMSLISPLMEIEVFGPEHLKAVNRAAELCEQLGEKQQLFVAIHNLISIHGCQGRFDQALAMNPRAFELAKEEDDDVLLAMAHWNNGTLCYWLGEYMKASEHLGRALELYHPDEHGDLCYQYGFEPAVNCWLYWGHCQWHLGYPERGLHGMRRTLDIAEHLPHLNSKAMAINASAHYAWLVGDMGWLKNLVSSFVQSLPERRRTPWEGAKNLWAGWLRLEEGDPNGGIEQMQRSAEQWGNTLDRAKYALIIGEALRQAGRHEEGLATVDAGFERLQSFQGEQPYVPALHRVRGDLLLGMNRSADDAEEAYRRAEEIARSHGARSWLLSIAMSQARLWARQGRRDEAFSKLKEIYDSFTEGFETCDLRQARELLQKLSA